MSNRRIWTLEEEDVLISILEGIVADGGRCDTGSFRSGIYDQVVSKMREKIENITITAKHVQNKMKRMKDKYSAAYDMLNTSGFGWDDTRKCVVVNIPEILHEYLKVSCYINSIIIYRILITCINLSLNSTVFSSSHSRLLAIHSFGYQGNRCLSIWKYKFCSILSISKYAEISKAYVLFQLF